MYYGTPDPPELENLPSGDGSSDMGGSMGVPNRTDDRLEADHKLYQRLIDSGFTGLGSELMAIRLSEYASPVLQRWISNGKIYQECGRVRRPVRPTWAELEYLDQHPEEIEYLVKDTVAEAWVLFRRCAVRGENAWEPTKGTSLTTYFVGTCKLAFQTIFRGWQREMKPRLTESRDSETYAELSADIDLEQQVVSEIIAAEMLDDLPGHIREIITLRLQGRTYTEIAEITGRKSARAVEAELKRYRDKRRGREGGS